MWKVIIQRGDFERSLLCSAKDAEKAINYWRNHGVYAVAIPPVITRNNGEVSKLRVGGK
jgi:hypothetical protein